MALRNVTNLNNQEYWTIFSVRNKLENRRQGAEKYFLPNFGRNPSLDNLGRSMNQHILKFR